MTDGNREQLVRNRAYEIWEAEGSPTGRDRDHWEQALREVEAQAKADDGADKPARRGRVRTEERSAGDAAAVATKAPRGGRRLKTATEEIMSTGGALLEAAPKRGRRSKPVDQDEAPPEGTEPAAAPRKRGRPRKVSPEVEAAADGHSSGSEPAEPERKALAPAGSDKPRRGRRKNA